MMNQPTDTASYPVCDSCSVGLANDDWSFNHNGSAASAAAVELMGNVVMTDRKTDGYGDCFVCDEIDINLAIWEGPLPR